jgi:hypothetical protein
MRPTLKIWHFLPEAYARPSIAGRVDMLGRGARD